MDNAELKLRILKLLSLHGRENAGKRLVMAGIHIDTAVRLLNGNYVSDPKKDLSTKVIKAFRD